MKFREITLLDEQIWLLPDGAIFLPKTGTLVVADLHLGKGTSASSRGMLLPPADTLATLECVAKLLDIYAPQKLVALGDSFHDGKAAERLLDDEKKQLEAITGKVPTVWVAGNHDVLPILGIAGTWVEKYQKGNLILRHIPAASVPFGKGELAGHLHPKIKMKIRGHAMSRPCFVVGTDRIILPSLGAYTGGLNVEDKAFVGLFSCVPSMYVWSADQIYRVT